MESGHSGASGRYDSLHEIARDFAFLFDLQGIKS
jgi:oligopeptidase B